MKKSIVPHIGKTGKLISVYVQSELRAAGFNLTVQQWVLLKLLSQHDGQIQNDLALITERNKASLTRLITNMEKKGFIRREVTATDARAKYVYLTKDGQTVYSQTLPTIKRAFKKMQMGISSDEINIALNVIERIQENIKLNSLSQINNKI